MEPDAYVRSNSYNTHMRFVSNLQMRRLRVERLQIQTKWMCYNCFVVWCMSGSKVPLTCVWHEERFYIAGPVPRNGAGDLADGKDTADRGVKLEKIPGIFKGRFYVSAPLSDSWEAFMPLHAGVTLGRFLYQLILVFFSPTSIASIIYGKILH